MKKVVNLSQTELQAKLKKANTIGKIKNIFKLVYGLPFTEITKQLVKDAKNEYGCFYKRIEICGNLGLMYTTNTNFANGKKNGYGAGIYLEVPAFGSSFKHVKIA